MTVEQVKKSKKAKKSDKNVQEESFGSLDKLIQIMDAIEAEEQVPELLEQENLLAESFKSLLKLMESKSLEDAAEEEEDFDTEVSDEKLIEIMSELLREGMIDEEEFEDFFTDALEADEDEAESEEEIDEESEEESLNASKKEKKSKHLRELEMLMEKVDDESDLDDDEYETEDDDEEEEVEFDDEENVESIGKKDIFANDEDGEVRMSSFEKSQAALAAEIAALESENVQNEKPWALRGEINARQRPSDSLLEEAVDFESLSRPVPQITEERTEEIEDVIKRRIEEAAWDDVERKDGRDLTLLNGMPVNNKKSARALLEDVATAAPQRSLAQVYEDDASTKLAGGVTAQDEETAAKQTELTALFAKICRHIDGLSGNRFAPKVYAQSDFQIKTLGSTKKL